MLNSPQRVRIGLPVVSLLVLGALIPVLPLGCETFGPEHKTEPDPTAHAPVENREVVARAAPPAPGKFATRRGYYVFYHDFDLDANDHIFADLETLPDQVCAELRLPPSNTVVQVFLFDTQERYDRFMRGTYAHLPSRRAYFLQKPVGVGSKNDLLIYTWMGEHLATDLRHELTHALLHGVLKDVPLWLDEGLAGYFELPPANEGVNPQYLDVVRHGSFDPNLSKLEKLVDVKQMEKPQYREAWAWVHFMLRSDPATKKVLQQYLQDLRGEPNPGPLLPRLREAIPDLEQQLASHFNMVEWPPPRAGRN